ncbi:MAG TPA: alkaline phosphatase family protein [Nocardioides sp.]|nr:alkaline phosphatase family protein [Nocardioides sp.]
MNPRPGLALPDNRPVSGFSRRALMGGALSAAAAGALPWQLQKAVAETPPGPRGRLKDIEHVVILMQENRSFDHYFGALPGVRGFDDPDAITLPNGASVFDQPVPGGGTLRPFRLDTETTSAQESVGLPHDWEDQHHAWNGGAMDSWIAAKGKLAMGYHTRDDIPFHWALAENFTVCDNYFCSVMGATNPNRLYMWSGWIDPDGRFGRPGDSNWMSADNPDLTWKTYPERLQEAGVTWRIYQEEDNYGDNSLEWFRQYADSGRTSPLRRHGLEKKSAGWFEYDAAHDQLPQVSWLVAPSAQTEHPNWMPAAGAQYIAAKLEAIAGNPDVWRKTAFILTYDENDGYFDHVPPPKAPPGTPGEFVDASPIGPGFRVPTIVISPWSVGGFACSEPFDHSSLVRLLEARFGVREPNISAWRRRSVGDLTSAFRFARGRRHYPADPNLSYRSATLGLTRAQFQVQNNPPPQPPATAVRPQGPLTRLPRGERVR